MFATVYRAPFAPTGLFHSVDTVLTSQDSIYQILIFPNFEEKFYQLSVGGGGFLSVVCGYQRFR
jgi:hypothetical protein